MIDRKTVLDIFHFRHACKEFAPDRTISDADFDMILETGRLSPSSFGYEPWQFVVIQDKAMREKLLPVTWGAKKTLPTSSHFIAILARRSGMLPGDPHIERMHAVQQMSPERIEGRSRVYRTFLESDFKLLGYENGVFDWACRQSYIALGNMMTAAAMIGIDSIPVEGFVQDDAEQILSDAGILDRKEFGLAVMCGFGYRVNPQSEKRRRDMREVVRWI